MDSFFYGFADEMTKHAGFFDWLFGKKKKPVKTEAPKSEPKPKLKVPKKVFLGKESRSRRALKREGVFGM